jgi:hypothetical protein
MADETKKYLLLVESNLKDLAKDAAEAKAKWDAAKESMTKLSEAGIKSGTVWEEQKAIAKNAQKEYNTLSKAVESQLVLINKETTYREKLVASKVLEIKAIKDLGSGYIKNAQGIDIVNPKLIQHEKHLADVNAAIIKYDKSLNDGRSNVGRYGEAIESAMGKLSALPGPAGRAASAVAAFGTQLKALLLNPILLAISAIVAGLALLGKAFVSTAEGAGVVKDSWAGLKASGDVLRDRAVSLIDTFHQLFKGNFTEAANQWAKAIDLGGLAMKNAANAAMELSAAQRELNKQLAFHISEEADENLEIQKYLFLSKDKALSDKVRIDMLQKSLELMKAQGQKAADFAREQFRIDSENAALKAKQSGVDAEAIRMWIALDQERQNATLKGSKNLQEFYNRIGGSKAVAELEASYARIAAANTELFQQGKRAASQLSTLTKELGDSNLAYWEDRWKNAEDIIEKEKVKEEALAKIRKDSEKAHRDQEVLAEKEGAKFIEDEIKRMDQAADKKWESEVELGRRLFEQQKANAQRLWDAQEEADKKELERLELKEKRKEQLISAGIEGAKMGADAIFEARTNRLNAEMTAELSNKNLTESQKVAINKKYAKLQQKIDISQALINGALAVGNALATTKPLIPAGLIAAALAALQAGIQVGVIKSQSFDGGGSAPTSISSSVPAQKSMSTPAGSSILTQPQLTQPQLNAFPTSPLLTAQDIADAMRNIPAPIVTVEDINNRQNQVNKVSVRANI